MARMSHIPPPPACAHHPQVNAAWFCGHCAKPLCNECVAHPAPGGSHAKPKCCHCGHAVNAIDTTPIEAEKIEDNRPFVMRLNDAMSYAIRGGGWPLMIGGSLAFGVLWLLGTWAEPKNLKDGYTIIGYILKGLQIILTIPVGIYLTSFAHRIMRATAEGQTELPDWPNPAEVWDEILRPFLMTLGVILFCEAPALIYSQLTHSFNALYYLLAMAGLVCMPLALLSMVVHNSLAAANPATVLRAMFKMQGDYWISVVLLVGAAVGCWALLPMLRAVWLIGAFLSAGAMLYTVITISHILAQAYHANRIAIGWIHQPVIKPIEEENGKAG